MRKINHTHKSIISRLIKSTKRTRLKLDCSHIAEKAYRNIQCGQDTVELNTFIFFMYNTCFELLNDDQVLDDIRSEFFDIVNDKYNIGEIEFKPDVCFDKLQSFIESALKQQ